MHGPGLDVLRSFVASANAQYRAAGLSEYQMHVAKDGTVSVPHRPSPRFNPPAANGSAATDQASAGAAPAAAPPAAASARRAGAAPKITGLQQGGADAFKLAWSPIAGAMQYGIWQDGVLLGHVASPSFAGQLAAGASGVIQVDAVRANGTRTALTKALRVALGADGKLKFDAPGAAASSGAAATASAAPAG